ncbi:MAG: hypothetical protein AB1465_07235 [Patescibacteria group bacterium]
MKIEDHLDSFKEHKETIFDWALKVKGLKNSQRIIGLHVSRAIIDLLSVYLHEKNKIDIGIQINHRWFKSEKVKEKLPEFSGKDIVIGDIIKLELLSEDLSYGAPKPIEKIKKALNLFKKLENKINSLRNEK